MAAWRQRMADPAVSRLAGTWTVELRVVSGVGLTTHALRAVGTVALVLNQERVTTALLGQPPLAFGTYDIPLDSMGVSSGDPLGTPDVWARVGADSVTLILSPKAKSPISLVGTWQGDSLMGHWSTEQRAGPNAFGDFILRRR